MNENFLEPNFYTLEMLSKKWRCEISDILHYGVTGQLVISALSTGWWIESGYYERSEDDEQDFPVPISYNYSNNELIDLYAQDIRDLVLSDRIEICRFPEKAGYLRISYNHHPNQVFITIKNLMISRANADALTKKQTEKKIEQNPSYTTPYIQLMLRAIDEFKITKERQEKAEVLKEWFLKQKIEDYQISDSAAKKLATFVRLPESKKGGNKKRVEG